MRPAWPKQTGTSVRLVLTKNSTTMKIIHILFMRKGDTTHKYFFSESLAEKYFMDCVRKVGITGHTSATTELFKELNYLMENQPGTELRWFSDEITEPKPKFKYVYLVIKIRDGENEYTSDSIHRISLRSNEYIFANNYIKNFYADKGEVDGDWHYFNGGTIACKLSTSCLISEQVYNTIKESPINL